MAVGKLVLEIILYMERSRERKIREIDIIMSIEIGRKGKLCGRQQRYGTAINHKHIKWNGKKSQAIH